MIVGGGFAGLGCAQRLADARSRPRHPDRPQQLPPVSAAALPGGDLAAGAERYCQFAAGGVRRRATTSTSSWPRSLRSTRRPGRSPRPMGNSGRGTRWCSRPGRSRTSSAPPARPSNSFPLYSLDNATNLRSRILGLFEQVDRNPELIQRGALNFVIVGGGPTGVEVAGAIADMVNVTVPAVYRDLDASAAQIHILDYGDALLKPFSDKAHAYVAKVLEEKGVQIHLGHGRQGGRHRPRAVVGRHDGRDALRGLGRRPQGGAGRRRRRSRSRTRRPRRRPARPDARPDTRVCTSSATSPTSPTRTTPRLPAAWLGRAAERQLGRQEHPG